MATDTTLGIDVEVVAKDPHIKGFSVVKRRWVIERTLGWIMLHRRLARDYEALPDNSASMIRIAMIDNLTKTRHQRNRPNLARRLKAASLAKYVTQTPSKPAGGGCAAARRRRAAAEQGVPRCR